MAALLEICAVRGGTVCLSVCFCVRLSFSVCLFLFVFVCFYLFVCDRFVVCFCLCLSVSVLCIWLSPFVCLCLFVYVRLSVPVLGVYFCVCFCMYMFRVYLSTCLCLFPRSLVYLIASVCLSSPVSVQKHKDGWTPFVFPLKLYWQMETGDRVRICSSEICSDVWVFCSNRFQLTSP